MAEGKKTQAVIFLEKWREWIRSTKQIPSYNEANKLWKRAGYEAGGIWWREWFEDRYRGEQIPRKLIDMLVKLLPEELWGNVCDYLMKEYEIYYKTKIERWYTGKKPTEENFKYTLPFPFDPTITYEELIKESVLLSRPSPTYRQFDVDFQYLSLAKSIRDIWCGYSFEYDVLFLWYEDNND